MSIQVCSKPIILYKMEMMCLILNSTFQKGHQNDNKYDLK